METASFRFRRSCASFDRPEGAPFPSHPLVVATPEAAMGPSLVDEALSEAEGTVGSADARQNFSALFDCRG